jgi:hypothetical protein
VRHGLWFLKRLDVDGFDLDDGKLLAMALLPLVALALALLENDDLFAAFVLKDGGLFGSARKGGLANPEIAPSPAARTSLISTVEPFSVPGKRLTIKTSPSETVNCRPWV